MSSHPKRVGPLSKGSASGLATQPSFATYNSAARSGWSGIAIAAANSSNSSSFATPPIRPPTAITLILDNHSAHIKPGSPISPPAASNSRSLPSTAQSGCERAAQPSDGPRFRKPLLYPAELRDLSNFNYLIHHIMVISPSVSHRFWHYLLGICECRPEGFSLIRLSKQPPTNRGCDSVFALIRGVGAWRRISIGGEHWAHPGCRRQLEHGAKPLPVGQAKDMSLGRPGITSYAVTKCLSSRHRSRSIARRRPSRAPAPRTPYQNKADFDHSFTAVGASAAVMTAKAGITPLMSSPFAKSIVL
jgi:hypothetical protein